MDGVLWRSGLNGQEISHPNKLRAIDLGNDRRRFVPYLDLDHVGVFGE